MSSESIGGKPKLDIDGLHSTWDQYQAIREHLRQTGNVLFPDHITESVKTSCLEHVRAVLEPLLMKMGETQGAPQPCVEPLRDEISALYKKMSKQVPDTQVVHDSWMIRKFLGFIKMKVRIRKPSTVLCLTLEFSFLAYPSFEI